MARTGKKVREQLEKHLKRAAESRKTDIVRPVRKPKPTRVYICHVGRDWRSCGPNDVVGVTVVESNGWVADIKLIQRTMEAAFPGKTAKFVQLI